MIVFGIAYLVALAAVLGAVHVSPSGSQKNGIVLLALAVVLVSGVVLSVATL